MAVIIPEGYAQTTLLYESQNFDGQQAATVLGFGGPLGDDPTSLEDFGNTVALAWAETLGNITDTDTTLVGVNVTGAVSSAFIPANISGVVAQTSVLPNAAALVQYKTNRRGRRAQGRSFLPSVVFTQFVDQRGLMTVAHRNDLQVEVNNFFENILAATPGVDQVILQGDSGLTPPLSPPPVVTSRSVSQLMASQRRRMRR